jgi:chorismate dehydratase
VAKLRVSIVEFLNTAPLVWGFTHGPLAGKYELSFTVPSLCAEALRRGEADVAIIPAIEYQRIENTVVLPGISIAAKGAVRSILVVAKRPIEQARRFALDVSSRSSVALVRLLCRRRWRIEPEFVDAKPDVNAMLHEADAALIIGDPALRIVLEAEQRAPESESLYLYDVAHEWREMTGKPCVLAFWAARREIATAELTADFLASKEYGMARIPEIAADASPKLQMPAPELERYLRENIDFSLDAENQAGLALYYKMCAETGLIQRERPLEFAARTGSGLGARGGA